jgi:hypothetical protein
VARQQYVEKNFRSDTLHTIELINDIVREYQRQGFVLTVRQLYYQLVARDIIANTLQEYKRIAGIINDAKLAGLLDWDMIEDRTREFVRQTRWSGGPQILKAAAQGFHMDMWEGQCTRVFVIVEKEALVGVLERVCRRYDIPLLAARGYPSGTVLREFVEKDICTAVSSNQQPVILHLGDHDPSGLDMTRDLAERIRLFAGVYLHGNVSDVHDIDLRRIALNMDQIRDQRPPENPAKTTDSRFRAYRKQFGDSSWELDALSPSFLESLIEEQVSVEIDDGPWEDRQAEIDDVKSRLTRVAEQWA